MAGGGTKRRFSSPSPSPGGGGCGGGGPPSAPASSAGGAKLSGRRMPSPVPSARCWSYSSGGGSGSGSRSSSPVPSKCVVPSLAAAKEERSRKNGREPAIVVPSRYRQPSPVGGRRLSGVGSGGGESGKKKGGVSGGGGRGLRKSWEEKEKSKVVVDQQAILTTQVAMSQRPQSDDGGKEQQPNNEEEQVTPKIEKQQTSSNKTQVPAPAAAASEPLLMKKKHLATKITVHDPKWTDGSIPFDTVSENLGRLGKEALQRRNAASAAAAAALEEALATESLIRCLSMFSNLCSSSKAGNPLPTIDSFLSIYEDAMKWIPPTCKSLLPNARNEATSTDHITKKPSSIWVDAALATDLQVVSLFDANFSGKPSVPPPPVAADFTRSSLSRKSFSSVSKTQAGTRTSGQGVAVGETLNFAKSLRREMQVWFMRFVEDALDVGFRLFGAELGGGVSDNARVAAILSQLKRVNEWVDQVGTMPEEEVVLVEEKIERLKRKIYGFIITHIESAFDSSVSLTNNKA